MKNILNFFSWSWKNFETWQKTYIFAMLIQIVGWVSPDPYGLILVSISMTIILSYCFKWFVYDSIKSSWLKYKKEKSQLFDTIKQSDLKS